MGMVFCDDGFDTASMNK